MQLDSDREGTDPGAMYQDGTYLKHNENWHQGDSPYKSRLVIKAITRNTLSFARCADVGCGAGLITELVARRFPDAAFTGFELSPDARVFWEKRARLPNLGYRNENLFDIDDRFDLVVCMDVFEHVEDYFGFLKGLRQKAKYFVFNVPLDMNVAKILSPGIRNAREKLGHLHYFNAYSAVRTLEDCGFRVMDQYFGAKFTAIPPRNLKQAVILPFRLMTLAFGHRFASSTFGGLSLVVTAANPDA